MNILSNAIDALEMSKGEWGWKSDTNVDFTPLIIRIDTEKNEEKNSIFIRLADNGPGMTEEVKKKMFDPFFTTKPVGKGTGLGLAISYQIVQKHDGVMDCISEPGKGTEFWIEIPMYQGNG
jgi:signal transduction histidine kinase